jgi:daunorubicin resistance ABC transporter ATP-binding subunit
MRATVAGMTRPAIVLEHVTRRFGSLCALDDVNLEVAPGTVFGLLGPNGAGKTTAVKILATLLPPSDGRAFVQGIDVEADPGRVRRCIGLAGQYAAVDVNLTGRENLRLIGRLSRLDRTRCRKRAVELLERFDLQAAADRPVRGYSGGMRRRLDVAAALVAEPDVLFLDEPTTGLDLPSRNSLWDLIRELVGTGATVVLTTQYLEEADQLADRIAVIDRGTVVAEGTPAALKARTGATVLDLGFGSEPEAIRAAAALERLGGRLTRSGERLSVTYDGSPSLLIAAVHTLDAAGLMPEGLQLRAPTLDDAFLQLTGPGAAPMVAGR